MIGRSASFGNGRLSLSALDAGGSAVFDERFHSVGADHCHRRSSRLDSLESLLCWTSDAKRLVVEKVGLVGLVWFGERFGWFEVGPFQGPTAWCLATGK